MKRLLGLIAVLGVCLSLQGQFTTVTGTIVDSQGITWINAGVIATFYPVPNFAGNYQWNGQSLKTFANVTGSADGSGHFSISVPTNSVISPAGSMWTISLCPVAASVCQTTVPIGLTPGTVDISTTITQTLKPLKIEPTPTQTAYADTQISPMPWVGQVYFNTSTGQYRQWNGTAWVNVGGGGSGATIVPTTVFLKGTAIGNQGVAAAPADMGTFLSGLTNCNNTSGFAYLPGANGCVAVGGGGGSPTGPQFKTGVYNVGGGPFTLGNANWGTDAGGNNFFMPTAGGSFFGGNNNKFIIAPSSGTYSEFTLNGVTGDGKRLGMVGGGTSDNNLYVDTLNGIKFRVGDGVSAVTELGKIDNTGLFAEGIGGYITPTNPAYNLGPLGNFSASARNYYENRNTAALIAIHAGPGPAQTQGFQTFDNFVGLGHLWRWSTNSIGASTQQGNYYQYNSGTPGQSIYNGGFMYCMSDGDCIRQETFQYSAGNCGQVNAECTHSDWDFMYSPSNAGPGPCLGGCGNTNQASIIWGGGVGQYSLIFDQTDVQNATIGAPSGGISGQPFQGVNLSGISFSVSKLFQINEAIKVDQNVTSTSAAGQPWQPTPTTVSINTTPAYTGALTTTSSLATNGIGCLANPPTSSGLSNEIDSREEYEPVFYQVVDSTHLKLWTTLVHSTNSLFAVGGACGMGIEQRAQTDSQGWPTVYPILASLSATQVIYAGGNISGKVIGTSGVRNFENGNCSVTQVSRSGTLATITTSGCSGVVGSLNGKTVAISGMTADVALNGTFQLTTNNVANQYTYTAGSGTIAPVSQTGTLHTGDQAAKIYPVALVLVPWNPAQPNNSQWYLTAPFNFPTVGATLSRALPYYEQFTGKAITVAPTADPFFGAIGYTIVLQNGAARSQLPGGVGSPNIGLDLENPTNPVGVYQSFGGTYLPPDEAIKVGGQWSTGVYFTDNAALGMFFDKRNTPPNSTTWNFCVFAANDGVSLCNSDVIGNGQSVLSANVGAFDFKTTTGQNLAAEIDPEFNAGEGFIKFHTYTVITPDHPVSTNTYSLIVNPPTGFSKAFQTTGFVNMTGLQSGLTCANALNVDASGNVFTGPCGGGGGGGTVGSGTIGQFAWYNATGTSVVGNTHLTDASGTLNAAEPVVITGTNNGFDGPGATLPGGTGGNGGVFVDPSSNVFAEENGVLSRVCTLGNKCGISNFNVAISSATLGAGACSSATNVTVTGLTTSMDILPGYTADPTGITGWGSSAGITYYVWPSAANTATWKVCNVSGASITYGAITFVNTVR